MRHTILVLASFWATSGLAQSIAQFDSQSGLLTIPEVKVGVASVYNARLKFDGVQTFTLQGFDTTPPGAMPPPPPPPVTQVPPLTSAAALQEWLNAGSYKSWKCESAAHGPTLGSPHGTVRICSNAILAASTSTSFPVGAASVKELYSGSAITGYAVGVKISEGSAASSWHWYERIGSSVVANSPGASICEGCHSSAKTDRVFVRVQ